MTVDRAPRARRTLSPAAQQHVAEALRLLYADAPGLAGNEALAQRERYRLEEQERSDPQGALPLGGQP